MLMVTVSARVVVYYVWCVTCRWRQAAGVSDARAHIYLGTRATHDDRRAHAIHAHTNRVVLWCRVFARSRVRVCERAAQ